MSCYEKDFTNICETDIMNAHTQRNNLYIINVLSPVGIGQINKCLNHYAIHAIVNVTYLTIHHQIYPCNPIQSTVLSFFKKYFDELQK